MKCKMNVGKESRTGILPVFGCSGFKSLGFSLFSSVCGSLILLLGDASAEPVATVGGKSISIEEVRSTAARKGYNLLDRESTTSALNDAVTFELLAAEAKREGYLDDPEIVRMAKSMAVKKLVAEKVDRPLKRETLTEDQLRAYYEAHPDEFSRPTVVRGRILMVLRREGAQSCFDEAAEQVRSGVEFAQVVKTYSDDAAARANGGMSRWLAEGQESRRYPESVLQSLFELSSVGAVSPPILTEKAFFMVQLVERRDGIVTDFQIAKQTIGRKVHARMRQEAYQAYVERLKQIFPVQVNSDALKAAMDERRAGIGPPTGPVRFAPAAAEQE